jgi:CRISPR type III-B/RAMP module RAMP protein Cmr1
MSWTTLHLMVVTPLFSGDDPDSGSADSPIRVPSIRGALRYWFRAVAAGHGVTDPDALWTLEESVFGSTAKPSPIRLRVAGDIRAGGLDTIPGWAGDEKTRFHGARYLLGQGLWRKALTRPFVAPGQKFRLQVRFSGNATDDARFMLALWAWLTYGGLGARTRRGFGQLACVGREGWLPGQWTDGHLRPPTSAALWNEYGRAAIPHHIRQLTDTGWTFTGASGATHRALSPIPALTPRSWEGRVLTLEPQTTPRTMAQAFDHAGRRWRAFRVNLPPDADELTVASPEWTHAIRGDDEEYLVAALGLPVNYFLPGRKDPPRQEFKATVQPRRGEEVLRRASPVWIRPALMDGQWGVFTHVFSATLLPADTTLAVTGGRVKTLRIPEDEYVQDAWAAWLAEEDFRVPPRFY